MTIINTYRNGNTKVTIESDGTKTREYDNVPSPVHPESIDIKITNYCDMGCKYCHEMSNTKGQHGDLKVLVEKTRKLPAGVEFAIGGGNPLAHPELLPFLTIMKNRGIICNLTVNQGHLKRYYHLINYLIKENLIKGLGISITNNNFKYVEKLSSLTNNIVYHVIAGVNTIDIIEKLMVLGDAKVLVLGYKTFGYGVNYHNQEVDDNIDKWNMYLPKYIGKCHLSFDNLAIEQLNVKRLFTDKGWDDFYMGDDFMFTMYIDAVEQNFAPTSRCDKRVSFDDTNLLDYFQKNRNT